MGNYLILLSLFFAAVVAIMSSKLRGKRLNLPPCPVTIPIFGNWPHLGDKLDHRVFANLAKKHGDIFHLRMGIRNLIVVSSPALAKEVLQTQGVEFGSRAHNPILDIFSGGGQDVLFADYGEHWRRMRRVITVSLFTSKCVRLHHQTWEDEAARLVDGLKKDSLDVAAVEGVSLKMRLLLLMHNNVFRMLFGWRFESVDDVSFLEVCGLNSKRSVMIQVPGYGYGDYVPILRPFMRGYLKICKEVCKKRLELFDYYVQQRRKGEGVENGGIEKILEAEEKGEITKEDVLYLIENLNVAGIGTVARAIEWAIAELVNNPRVLKKLQHELDTILGPGNQITEPDMKKLPYLHAVLKETMRLHTLAPLLAPHVNINEAKLGGFDIPAESRINVNSWWLSNNPAHWIVPEEFRPERFLEEEANVEITGNDFRYIPFGVGRRSCPGIAAAMPILGVTLGRLVQNFDFLPPSGHRKIDTAEKKGSQFGLHMSKPFTVILRSR